MAKWKPLERMDFLGKAYPRVEGPDKVSGRAKYTQDQAPAGMLYGAILTSPHAAAKIIRIDDSKVRQQTELALKL